MVLRYLSASRQVVIMVQMPFSKVSNKLVKRNDSFSTIWHSTLEKSVRRSTVAEAVGGFLRSPPHLDIPRRPYYQESSLLLYDIIIPPHS